MGLQNKVKEGFNRFMQGVTHFGVGLAEGIERGAMLLGWNQLADKSREVSNALQESHDRWKDRADRCQHERVVGANTRPKQYNPDKERRAVAESAIQAIESHCKPGLNLHDTLTQQTPEERLDFIEAVASDLAQRSGLQIEPIDYFESERLRFGYFSPSENRIRINATLIASDNIYMVEEQIYTIVHETMHAIQHHAVEQELATPGSSGFDPQLVCDWAKNFLHYIRPEVDPEGYRNQPLERDAYGIEWILKNYFSNN